MVEVCSSLKQNQPLCNFKSSVCMSMHATDPSHCVALTLCGRSAVRLDLVFLLAAQFWKKLYSTASYLYYTVLNVFIA